ncbi:MAG: hypothetical protein E4H41_01245 [Gemmatimonadales bacterium]|jgi:hypothetical protein|nr:MAG: hypothetical protein E4H41_01245 [Gemmatimonadales bacterium]
MLCLMLALGCTDDPPPPQQTVEADATPRTTAFPTLPDSLVLTAPHGVTIWFSGARTGTDSLGATCTERGLVIARDSVRTLVPLLMTGTAPVLVTDTTIRARIWLHCRPGNTYEVNLRTGTPTRVK